MGDPAKTIGNLIDKAGNAILRSASENKYKLAFTAKTQRTQSNAK
jgi:hypothetical protein